MGEIFISIFHIFAGDIHEAFKTKYLWSEKCLFMILMYMQIEHKKEIC